MNIRKSEERVLFNSKTQQEKKSIALANREINRDKEFLQFQKEVESYKAKHLRELAILEKKRDKLINEIMKRELRIKVIDNAPPENRVACASVSHLNRILACLEEKPLGKDEIRKRLGLGMYAKSAVSFLTKNGLIKQEGFHYQLNGKTMKGGETNNGNAKEPDGFVG